MVGGDAMSGSNIVPFGRYKGQPVADMLADAEYMAWVEAQPWFRARYMHLLSQRDIEAANRTPVHNRLQTLFLDQNYQHAFMQAVSEDYRKTLRQGADAKGDASERATKRIATLNLRIAECEKFLAEHPLNFTNIYGKTSNKPSNEWERNAQASASDDCRKQIAIINDFLKSYQDLDIRVEHEFSVRFESEGADVYLSWFGSYPYLVYRDWENARNSETVITKTSTRDSARIEIKPTVADEYPAILRQMKRNQSDFLFVDDYQGEGATELQFVKIFAASHKAVIFKRNVDHVVAERLLAQLDAAGIGLTLKPDGKVTIAAGASPSPDLLASARVHREAIIALLQERAAGAKPIIPVHQDDVL